ncbi:hypothetical protein TVAG_063230 [Trichomonas vaginalis G3]|uniref:Pre-mRNA processing factor 4 (PRP4)-like domain-containing protein n=1 Tax=Trichomonas vaginalis (strain ATCC PRA-98 / G3) TaxID=412133 RepID=A2DLT5_TRIV3|nr:U4 snRNA binding [Trichomonas vaginalis G3]EAY18718.1 hypothetical protein TVAG_063230 [Trichomonas vaginalis G3]KAI5522622.1 U4 snRNA binding [Trichomonas vaginalis G3]|eukprot:XP_001579704.1 hypothetical protein [Trichomonas vaginalis G3]
MTHVGSEYENYLLKKKMSQIPVPTDDADIMKMLRKVGEPICLFGEDPADRRERLKRVLAQGIATDVFDEEEEISFIPKYDTGGNEISEMKKFLISFSIPRAHLRMQAERQIDQERINTTNQLGSNFKDYSVTACDHADTRPLSSLYCRNNMFLIGSRSGNISLWNLSNLSKICDFNGHSNRIIDAKFLTDDIIISSSADKTIRIWKSPNSESCIAMNSEISSMDIHPSQRYIIAGLSDGTFNVIDIERETNIVTMKSNDGSVTAVSSHTDGGLVFCGGNDSVGKLWDLRNCHAIKTMMGHSRQITCSSFDTGFHCITGSYDNTVIVWDLRNLTRSKKIGAHLAPISSVSIYDDLLMTSSVDQTMKIWSLLDFRIYSVLKNHNVPILRAKFIENDPKSLLTVGKDGMWRLFTHPIF